MAARRDPRPSSGGSKNSERTLRNWIKTRAKWDYLMGILKDPRRLATLGCIFVILEAILNVIVIEKVRYTEIDWTAYMQEVEGFLNGTTDYGKLRGDTGPLVYPAGFVYFFALLYYATSAGANVKLGQYIFALLYIAALCLVLRIYSRTKTVPPYVLILIFCTSYRIHSIFVLRLFNDPIAMIFVFAAINAFLDEKWSLGSVLYSLGVSIKMNVLLFAPGLLIAYLANLGLAGTLFQLSICAGIQLILGFPFIATNPVSYLRGAFDFGRVFQHKWTVNWRFLPEETFVSPHFHLALLFLHLATLAYFIPSWITYMKSYARLKHIEKTIKPQLKGDETVDMSVNSRLFVLPLFAANFIGVAFARSLHYQFYVWYYHTLPYIAWHSRYSDTTRIVILGIIELCWNTYPSTIYSSAALHLCHLALLYGLHTSRVTAIKAE
ncbi:lethal(2)neighbour of tid protein [Venturia canescens]|uniref:lethal(2)neighbour of tid protein n=1 Tax=Venturia canescens TaxID=32260 RepID=UPI001C9BCBD5|nr:lethal(2)neighbour of tid protein [Venturia canescens]